MNATFELSRDYYKDIFCVVSEYSRCDPHFHSNIEIVYMLEGEMEVTINNHTAVLRPGWVSIANSYDIHTYKTPHYSKARILIVPTDIVKSFNNLTKTVNFASPFMENCECSRDIDSATLRLTEFNNTRNSLVAKGLIYFVLGILIEKIGLKNRDEGSQSDTLMKNILIYLENNYLNRLTREDLAKHFGYSQNYLSRLFNSKLGCGMNQYINVLRARHAASLIHDTNLSLTEIAYQSGFGSCRTFTRAFKEFYNITPSEYKGLIKNQT
ncbi:MAG TPA: AraC family transcriptional regulator [Clostridiales bacterium]|nr:AraC family transcriptional regulator [Clostridiales bacterium]